MNNDGAWPATCGPGCARSCRPAGLPTSDAGDAGRGRSSCTIKDWAMLMGLLQDHVCPEDMACRYMCVVSAAANGFAMFGRSQQNLEMGRELAHVCALSAGLDISAKEFDLENGLLKKLDPGNDPDVKKVDSYFSHYGV